MTGLPPCIELEHAPCPLGCGAGDIVVLTGCDRLHGLPGMFTVVRCRTCGLVRTDPRPTATTMGYYYPDTHAPHREPEILTPVTFVTNLSMWKRLARRWYHALSIYHGDTQRRNADGKEGRSIAERHFGKRTVAEALSEIFQELA